MIFLEFCHSFRVWDQAQSGRNGEFVMCRGRTEIDALVGDHALPEFDIGEGALRYWRIRQAGHVMIVTGVAGGHGFVVRAVALGMEQGGFFPKRPLGSQCLDGGFSEWKLQ